MTTQMRVECGHSGLAERLDERGIKARNRGQVDGCTEMEEPELGQALGKDEIGELCWNM
jgi:hypothetical protein